MVSYLWQHPHRHVVADFAAQRPAARLADVAPAGGRVYRPHSNNNEFGLDNEKWDRELCQEMVQKRNTRSDEDFLRTLHQNKEWADLELMLRGLTEFGAQPLLLSMPIHGHWYDQCGVTYTARRAYYQELREIAARYHAAVVDFADHDADQSFCHDTMGHLAPSGLVYYGQVLDGFFHDKLPRQPELAASGRVATTATGPGLPLRPAPPSQPPSETTHGPSSATAIEDGSFRTNPQPTLQGQKGKP